jgi:septal ring factor EnvC (AmiA/AmiB activator)
VNERSRKNRLVSNLNRQERNLRKQLQDKQRIAGEIEKEIQALIEREKEKMKYATLTPGDKIISDAFQKNKGGLPWPVGRGIITSAYGRHRNAVFKDVVEDNMGIEITSENGEKARSVFKGTVAKVFGIPGANQIVIIRHGNYLSVYQNLVNVQVAPGDAVETKEIIADIFQDPALDGKCVLKFMIFHEKEKQNPEIWLSK